MSATKVCLRSAISPLRETSDTDFSKNRKSIVITNYEFNFLTFPSLHFVRGQAPEHEMDCFLALLPLCHLAIF